MLETTPSDTTPSSAGGSFTHLYRQAGPAFFPIGVLARLPFAMLTLGISSYVAFVRDSYAQGGLAAGSYALGAAVGAALAGACADRYGQRRVIPPLVVANSVLIAAVLFAAHGALPLLLVVSALCGLTIPPVGPFSRVRWAALVHAGVPRAARDRVQGAAFGYETLADEMTFVFGPAIVGLLAQTGADTPLIACTAITLVFGLMFARHRTSGAVWDPASVTSAGAAPLRAFLRTDRTTLVATMLLVGALLGALMNTVVAFAGEHGSLSDAGLIYAGFGIGSGAASIAVGWMRGRTGPHLRMVLAAIWAVAVCAALPWIQDGRLVAGALTLVGLGIGPIIVTVYELAAAHTPAGRLTLHMTMLSSALIAGTALGAPMAGALAESSGAATGFRGVLAVSALVMALAVASHVAARGVAARAPQETPDDCLVD
ncbi:MFS transporter [Rhodococcus sp. NPDC058514]|uniref:MFS transporter n=1 Tax=unclassified Rhodococcus (in: high G+C Gram-positive bacteria) TaxID=192944 RepID=UPI003669A2EF